MSAMDRVFHAGRCSVPPMVRLFAAVFVVAIVNITTMFHFSVTGKTSLQQSSVASWLPDFVAVDTASDSHHLQSFRSFKNVVLQRVSEAMIEAFMANASSSITRHSFPRFIISSKNPNLDSKVHQCQCDLLTLDCIDSIACIPKNKGHRNALTLLGVELRKAMTSIAKLQKEAWEISEIPIGKTLQYATMDTWESWKWGNTLPRSHDSSEHIFVNRTQYPYCHKHNLSGMACFFRDLDTLEDFGLVERDAQAWFDNTFDNDGSSDPMQQIRERLHNFLRNQQKQMNGVLISREEITKVKRSRGGMSIPTSTMSTLGQLTLFSNMLRLLFKRQPFLQDIFEERLTVRKPKKKTKKETGAHQPFTVSLHMRRGDSCSFDENFKLREYKSMPSDLFSPAQTSDIRMCYESIVYLQVLERIRAILPKEQPLHVYLSTDDTGSVLEELALNHSHIYHSVVDQWIYMNYSRSHFQYDMVTHAIESDENENKAVLGETAVNDLWLLSHGQAFIGHLGSRFGKMGWLLATARHNTFIPYFSVDGHSESFDLLLCLSLSLCVRRSLILFLVCPCNRLLL